jgi:hypothetical protein
VKHDQIWHYWILLGIVQDFDKQLISELKNDLIKLVNRKDKEGASIQALRILKENQILSEEQVEEQYQNLLNEYRGDDYWINDLNEEIKPVANNG